MKQKILLLSFLFLSLIGYAQPIDWNKKLPADQNVLIGKLIPAGTGLQAYRTFAEELVPAETVQEKEATLEEI